MANPLKVVRNLLKLLAEANSEALLKPETVTAALEAVRDLLGIGLPAKEAFYDEASGPETLKTLAAFYHPHGRPALAAGGITAGDGTTGDGTAGDGAPGAGDRLYRDDVTRLAEGLTDVAERVTLATSLRNARREAGYSIRELARFAGVHHSYLSRVERGAVPRPSDAVMARLAAPLGLPGAPAAPEGAVDLAGLGLHRSGVRALLKVVRGLPDEHVELLAAQARAMLAQTRKRLTGGGPAPKPGPRPKREAFRPAGPKPRAPGAQPASCLGSPPPGSRRHP